MKNENSRTLTPEWGMFGAWAGLSQAALSTSATAMEIWMNTANAMVTNYTDYLSERSRQNMAVWEKMLRCESCRDLAEAQQNFTEQFLTSCRDETEKLAGMASSGAVAIAKQARGGEQVPANRAAAA